MAIAQHHSQQFFSQVGMEPPLPGSDSDSVMVRASASGAGGRGFNPGLGHTKDFKNGTNGYLAWRSAL